MNKRLPLVVIAFFLAAVFAPTELLVSRRVTGAEREPVLGDLLVPTTRHSPEGDANDLDAAAPVTSAADTDSGAHLEAIFQSPSRRVRDAWHDKELVGRPMRTFLVPDEYELFWGAGSMLLWSSRPEHGFVRLCRFGCEPGHGTLEVDVASPRSRAWPCYARTMSIQEARRNLSVLARADGNLVVLGPIGFAAQVTEECRAYRELLADRGALAALKGELEALAAAGSAVARIYAALLLRVVDETAARIRLEAMLKSREPCAITHGGCVIPSGTLGETARSLLAPETTHAR